MLIYVNPLNFQSFDPGILPIILELNRSSQLLESAPWFLE